MFFRSHFGVALLLTLFVVFPDRAEAQAAQGQAPPSKAL